MSQSSSIAAALIIGFIVFITVRGELPSYLAVFNGQAPATPAPGTKTPAAPGTTAGNNLFGIDLTPGSEGTTINTGNQTIASGGGFIDFTAIADDWFRSHGQFPGEAYGAGGVGGIGGYWGTEAPPWWAI